MTAPVGRPHKLAAVLPGAAKAAREFNDAKRKEKLKRDLKAVEKRFNSEEEKARLADLVDAMGNPERWSVVVCQSCGNRLLGPSAICGTCGHVNLKAPDLLPRPADAAPAPEVRYCTTCSAVLTGSGRFCYTCGAKQEKKENSTCITSPSESVARTDAACKG